MWRQAAAASADERNDAVGAAIIAAVLNFQDGPSAIGRNSRAAFEGTNLHGGLREDVTRKDFGGAARERHRRSVENRERDEISRRRKRRSFAGAIRDRANSAWRVRVC